MADNSEYKFKVLHAPNDIGGNAYYLAQGERTYGFDSRNLVYSKQWFGYPADYYLRLKHYSNPIRSLRWWLLMIRLALNYDVLHFNFGASFLTYFQGRWTFPDLPLWRTLHMATFITFQGCDSRITSYVMENLDVKICTNCRSRRDLCEPYFDDFRMDIIKQAERYFDRIFVLNPDLLRNIPKGEFLPYSNCDLDEWQPPTDYDWYHSGSVRVLHAPTWRELKGTDTVVAVIEELRAEGENVELILIEKIPHDQVKALFTSADLFVDQLLAGWYGGVAVELMALGKPVVAYIRQEDLHFIPAEMKADLPIISADTTTLKEVLRDLIRDPDRRKRVGEQSRAFVEKWHHPRVVAQMTTTAYRQALEKRPPIRGAFNRLRILFKVARPTLSYFWLIYRANSVVHYFKNWIRKRMGWQLR